MIVTDTNVVSEPLKPHPDARVIGWLQRHRDEVAITAITIGELRHGALQLPPGNRRDKLMTSVSFLVDGMKERQLAFDPLAAEEYATIRAEREAAGRNIGVEDTMIAGICRSRGAAIATRNVRHFEGTGIIVINPWTDE